MPSDAERFRFIRADSEDLKQAIYRLRYQIYVEEFGFEHAEDHPSGLETDPYEPHAVHIAALNEDDQVIGTLRLILHSELGFPIEHAVELKLPGAHPPPDTTIEVSRLAISAAYRRRAEDTSLYGVESYIKVSEGGILPDSGTVPAQYARRQQPAIILGLIGALWQTSKRMGVTHWYMISEKKLWHTLDKFGILFHQVGEPVEYHGLRIPYMVPLTELDDHLRRVNPSLYEMYLSGLEAEYHPQVRV
jgi:N-acyl amino acid synthase of PEP-CTERM/exosortase system